MTVKELYEKCAEIDCEDMELRISYYDHEKNDFDTIGLEINDVYNDGLYMLLESGIEK